MVAEMVMMMMVVITDDTNDATTIDWIQFGPFTAYGHVKTIINF